MSTGSLLVKVDGSLGFCPNTRWNGEKPCTFASEFLAFRHHANVKSMSRCCDSSKTLSIMSAMMKFCLSTNPLLNGDSAAVTLTVMFIHSAISIDFELANSQPLSVKHFSDAPCMCIHDLKIALRMTSGSFDMAKLDTDNLVAWLMKCRFYFHKILNSFQYIPDVAMGRPTTGRCGGFQYILQIPHSWRTFVINFCSSPVDLSNFSSFSGEECANCG